MPAAGRNANVPGSVVGAVACNQWMGQATGSEEGEGKGGVLTVRRTVSAGKLWKFGCYLGRSPRENSAGADTKRGHEASGMDMPLGTMR